MKPSLILTAATLVLAGCAPAGSPLSDNAGASSDRAARACFTPREVVNFRSVRSQTLYVRTSRDDVFEIGSAGCLDLQSAYGIAITPTIGISDRLCVGDGARIAVPDRSVPQGPCLARVIRSLTPAEVEALPERDRP